MEKNKKTGKKEENKNQSKEVKTETQDNIFLSFEGDRWFERNKEKLIPKEDDLVIKILREYGLLSRDKKVIELGASNGYRLAKIHEIYGCEVHAVEPSPEAVEDGRKKFPFIKFYRTIIKDIEVEKENLEEYFDIAIVFSVLHWIDRKNLLISIAKIDELIKDGGFLIIGDFQTPFPIKREYHHIKEDEVYTFKLRYKDIFLATGMYLEMASFSFNHDNKKLGDVDDLNVLYQISLLKKTSLYIKEFKI